MKDIFVNKKAQKIIIIVSIIGLLIWFFSANLTPFYIDYITMVKGDDLTWEDFERFPCKEVGSGLYIREYNIIGGGDLIIGGPSLDEEPWYIEIIELDGGRYRIKG